MAFARLTAPLLLLLIAWSAHPQQLARETEPSLDRSVQLGEDEVYGDGDKVYWNEKEEVVILEGNAFLKCGGVQLQADRIWFDYRQNLLRARGHVLLEVDGEQVYADELLFDVKAKKGTVLKGAAYSRPWFYGGDKIYKTGEKESFIRGGRVTSCSLKHPHYWFEASKIIVRVDKELIAKHVVLKIGGIPMLYLPVYRRDLRKERLAKVIVKLGMDSYQGYFTHIILPIRRGSKLSSYAFYEYTTRRGTGIGIEAKYNVNDVRLREIFIKLPENPTRMDIKAAQEKAQEMLERLRGEYDRYRLQRIFIRYRVTDEDIRRAEREAERIREEAVKGGDFAQLARERSEDATSKYRGGDLGYIIEGEGKLPPEVERIVFKLKPGEVSHVIPVEGGFEIYKVDEFLDLYGRHEIRLRRIRISVKPSDKAKEEARRKGEEALRRIESGEPFEKVASELSDEPYDMGWIGLNEINPAYRYRIKRLKPGGHTDLIQTDEGVYIFKLIEKEPTPTFEQLARRFSDGKEAERGGDLGYRTRRELPREVARVAFARGGELEKALDIGDVSGVIRTKDGFHVVKLEDSRFFSGDIFLFTGDIYSYGRRETYKTGRRWDFIFNHRQLISTPWDSRARQRRLILLTKASLGRRTLLYTPISSSELRTFAQLTWTTLIGRATAREFPSRFTAKLTLDKTFELGQEESYAIQELPELYVRWSGGKMRSLPILGRINRTLNSIAEKIRSERFPILTLPTLDNAYIDADLTVGNYYKAVYGKEKDIYLQTGEMGVNFSKEGTINLTKYHEIPFRISGDFNLIWHSKDRRGDRNIFLWKYGLNASASIDLFRIYDISFIPKASKLRHEIGFNATFNYNPEIKRRKYLYPFGPTAYAFERKRLHLELSSSLEIKTRKNVKYQLLSFDAYTTRDFASPRYLGYRRWDYIRSSLSIRPTPSGNLSLSFTSTHDPNPREGRRFKQVGFSSSLSYRRGDYTRGLEFHIGNQFTKFYQTPYRTILFGFDLRPSRLFQLEVDVQYDWIRRDFYSQRLTLRRNLHDWDLRITWWRIGYGASLRKDFTFQINLIADPSAAIGIGYDAVLESWGIRTLPVGMPYYGFIGRGLGRSYGGY